MIALAMMLLASAIVGWHMIAAAIWTTRAYVRFACVLYATVAVASAIGSQIAVSVMLIVSASAPVLLAFAARFALRGPVASWIVATVLAGACVSGMSAAATGLAVLAIAPLLLSASAMIVLGIRCFDELRAQAIEMISASCALLAGASAFAAGGVRAEPALILFSAAGLFGISLVLAPRSDVLVEQESTPDLRAAAIRQTR